MRVRVAFSQHVDVDASGGEPYVELTVGAATRRAEYRSSRQNYLDFAYRVQADDFDDDGVGVPANGLALNGASVVARNDPAVAADPSHGAAEGGFSRKVDGTRERPPSPTLTASGSSVAEGDAGSTAKLEFAVRLSPAAPARVTVDWADAGSGSATTGADLPDGGAAGVSTIVDDDGAPTLSVDSTAVTEDDNGNRRLTFTFALDRPSGRDLALRYADAGTGTATSGTDYEAVAPDTLFFNAGQTQKSLDVQGAVRFR